VLIDGKQGVLKKKHKPERIRKDEFEKLKEFKKERRRMCRIGTSKYILDVFRGDYAKKIILFEVDPY